MARPIPVVSRPFSGASVTSVGRYCTPRPAGHLVVSPDATDLLSPGIPKYTRMTRTISTKLPEDLIDEIEEYQEDDESRSAAVRRLIRSGLDAERSDRSNPLISGVTTAGIVVAFLSVAGNVSLQVGAVAALLVIGAVAYDVSG